MDSHKYKNGTTQTSMSSLPSKSELLNSPNTANWEPDVRLLLSTSQWLKVHGLRRRKLDMAQILPSIGFRHSDDYVKPLKKPVRARYCQGLFTQVPYRDGSVFNLVASKEKLGSIENQLKHAISLYKKRLEWLTTESRRVFGVIEEHCICIVLDVDVTTDSQFDVYRHALTQVLKEQVMFMAKINLIRCAMDMECWEDHAVNVTLDSMESALRWLWNLNRLSPRSSTCTVEAVQRAITDDHVEAVFIFTEGSSSDGAQEMLRRKVQESRVPIHIVSFNCTKPSTMKFLKEVCHLSRGRFHAFSVSDEYEDAFDSFSYTIEDENTLPRPVGRGRGDGMPSLKLGVGVREDVITLWEELDEARNTLAEIQALQCEIKDSRSTPISTDPSQSDTRSPAQDGETRTSKSELYMSSRDWLKRHGLKGKRLGFYDLLGTLAFKHCDGVVDIQRPPSGMDGTDAIVRPKLVNAKYCDKFAHVRWKDGTIMHVHVSGPVHRNYEQRMLSALDSYKKRMEWLQKGSRELFGTIIEDQVCILIDTSSSMASRLFLVKDKLYRLMQEQLRHKIKFNLVKFDSRTQAWRDRLVDCNTHNLDNAWHWVKGLSTGGSTNTLAALKLAMSDPQCHAIYLLTDGRPDQPPSSILAQIHLHSPIPVHTISFNCADSEANEFLCKLAQETGGRFHYFSEDGYDVNGPRPYESVDLRLLREEIERGLGDLKKVALLRNECAQLDWFGSNTGRSCSRDHIRTSSGPLRPSSAKQANPSPPNSLRPASARARPATGLARPASARILHSSYKDYIVSSACKNVPKRSKRTKEKCSVPLETRASLLRLNLRKKTSNWMLPETRDYLTKKPEDYRKQRKKGIKTRRNPRQEEEQSEEDLPIKKWLKKHGLVARKLTILDALAPTIVPHSTKYVPVLDKHVLSKVFDQVLPLAHTSGSGRDEVQLVNPQGVNLKAYEARLEIATGGFKRKLDEHVFSALSDQERLSYEGNNIPSFEANRESMMSDLEKHGWPIDRDDITLLEKEIEQAEVFLRQSRDLRKASEQAGKEIAEKQRKAREEAERKRMEQVMAKPDVKASQPNTATFQGNKNRLKNHKVLARNEVDGFYYPGIVTRGLNSRYVEVDFNDFDHQVVSVRYVIPMEGARPCPNLKVGDYVLVKTLVPREDYDDMLMDGLCCYVPGLVQVLPLKRSQTSKCYTILRFNGKKITSVRNDLVKISKARYTFACRYIRDSLLSAYKSTSPFGVHSTTKSQQQARIVVTPEHHRSRSRSNSDSSNHSRSQSHSRSRSRSRSRSHSSQSGSSASNGSRSRSRSRSLSRSRSHSGSQSRSRSGSRSRGSSKSPDTRFCEVDGKKGIDSSTSSEDEEEQNNDRGEEPDKFRKQMDELTNQERRLEALREHLFEEQEKQRKENEELENKRRELQEQQQKLIQCQLDEQREKHEKFQEEQKQLQKQQEELLKRQREQQEQLLMQQHTQTQSLNLQQQQLVQQLANMVQQRTENAVPEANKSPLPSPVSSVQSSPRRSTRSSPGVSPRASPCHSAASSPRSSAKSSVSPSPKATPRDSTVTSRMSSRPSTAKKTSSNSSSRKSSRPSSAHIAEGHESDSSISSSSSLSSSSSSSSSDSNQSDGGSSKAKDEEDGAPPDIKFHVNGDNEACLVTKGTHGLLISRKPLDQDPAVDARHLPKPVKIGDEVLARWSDEGWYYRGTIKQDCQDGTFFVEDSVGDLEQIHRSDMITDEDDADSIIKVGDPVVGLHPSFSFSYAPGVVISEEEDSMYSIRYYDGIEGVIPRDELYKLSDEKFESVCNYILTCEESLVGQAVVARNDQDGLFHLGSVRERVGNGRQYIIEWADQTVQLQSSGYMFGAHTKRHPLAIGDRVLALSDPATFVHMPGWITGSNGRRLVVKFCNGKSSSHVDPLNCYWLSRDYYDRLVEDYRKKNK